ncbi:MAG: hypothetical protein HW419_3938 [Deltaproteobacteria bacterium]|nr:hypothetical protein [Deltaproteobacteria bacterium]
MKSESEQRLHARDYIASLAATGRYHFASKDARGALGVSAAASKLALSRLARQKMIASPARGFYVVIPPEYRSLGCLPADQFIPALMKRQGQSYYAGLLSAAQYHGAAHHRSFNTPRGTILVSTPEATAVDLVGYHHHAGGLDQVATILSELAEQIDPQKLVNAARTAPVPWAQRLGYLLEHVSAAEKAAALKTFVKDAAREAVPLLPGANKEDARRDTAWKLLINTDLEPEL